MIIKKIDIGAFGKLKQKVIEPAKGFNLIFGNNEDGKTTVMSFIMMMFYGKGGGGRSSDLLKNTRRKYTPWDGDTMSGAIEFETAASSYRVDKVFKKTAASDKTTVLNTDLGEYVELPANEEVGESFLGMTPGEFERSVFIGQSGAFSSDASADTLAMRIANLAVSGDEKISRDAVLSRINSAKEELISKSGKKGVLVESTAELEALREKKNNLKNQISAQKAISDKAKALEGEIAACQSALKALDKVQAAVAAKKELNAYHSLDKKNSAISLCEARLSDKGADMKAVEKTISQCRLLKEKISESTRLVRTDGSAFADDEALARLNEQNHLSENIRRDIELLRASADSERERLDAICRENARREKHKRAIAAVFAITITAVAIAAGVLVLNKFFLGVLLALPFAVFCAVYKRCNQKSTDTAVCPVPSALLRSLNLSDKLSGVSSFDEAIEILEKLLRVSESSYAAILCEHGANSLSEIEERLRTAQDKQLQTKRALENLQQQFVDTISFVAEVSDFSSALLKYAAIVQGLDEITFLKRDLATIARTAGIESTAPDFVKKEITRLEKAVSEAPANFEDSPDRIQVDAELSEKRAQLDECLRALHAPDEDIAELDYRLKNCKETVDALRSRYESLTLVEEVMNEAVSETDRGLGSYLSRHTGEYLSRISGGKYSDVIVSRDLTVEARGNDDRTYREWKYFSGGAIDRIYLALRLAATDIITKDHEPLPIFLDDILAQYDDDKCTETLDFLKEYLNRGDGSEQILFFTCHKHIADSARRIFGELHEITL